MLSFDKSNDQRLVEQVVHSSRNSPDEGATRGAAQVIELGAPPSKRLP